MAQKGKARKGTAPAPSLASDDRLLLDVIESLRGADNLRVRCLSALQSGTPSVADLVYAIKGRVKEDYKTVDKIKDRRRGGDDRAPQPNYGPADVTDLVGLRLITLYRLDVIEVLHALISTIDQDDSASAVFEPKSVSEVKIYSTNPNGDVQQLPQRVKELFESYGFGTVTQIVEKPSNYSSIHIIVRGRGKYRDSYRTIPVEIQIRTALEDVWGQIEHGLKYKRKRLQSAQGNSTSNDRLASTLRHLGALKTMIDGIAQYGDQIKLQIDELEPELRTTESKIAEEVDVRLSALKDLPEALKKEIAEIVAEARPALIGGKLSLDNRTKILRSALSKLDLHEDTPSALPDIKSKSRKELGYVINMQRALINFQLGNLLNGKGKFLLRAAEIYSRMEREFPLRIIVAYRLAQTQDALGARSEAISKLREVVGRLNESSEPTPQDHWVRSAAPRVLGVLLWEEAKSIGLDEVASGQNDDVLRLLQEAFLLTLAAVRVPLNDGTTTAADPHTAGEASERSKATNNLLYFLLEYLEAGGRPHGEMGEDQIRAYLEELGGNSPANLGNLSAADTVRRAHAYLGNSELEVEAARAVLSFSSQSVLPHSPVVRSAIRAAEKTLKNIAT